MGMSGSYGPADDEESIAAIHAALDAGINLLDTGDYYGMGHNEMLIGQALRGRRRDAVVLSVKFGGLRAPDGAFVGIDGRPPAVKNFLAYTLGRLGVDYIDIYRLGRVDPEVPIEETVGAIAEMIAAGYVRHVGLSEAGSETLRRAQAVHPVADLQIEYSLLSRGIEAEILPTCRALDVGITAYGVLSRGLLGGELSATGSFARGDARAHMPRFRPDNLARNLSIVDRLRAIAAQKHATVAQVALAWVLSRGDDIVPVVGMRSPGRVAEAVVALDLRLNETELAAIEETAPLGAVAGSRYDEHHVDAEARTDQTLDLENATGPRARPCQLHRLVQRPPQAPFPPGHRGRSDQAVGTPRDARAIQSGSRHLSRGIQLKEPTRNPGRSTHIWLSCC